MLMASAFSMLEPRSQRRRRGAPYHEWRFPDRVLWTQFFRVGSGYLLRFPRLADFDIAGDTLAVRCHPVPGITADTCEHLYLNQVLPLVWSRQDKLVFHASAVEIAGAAVAFLGESGRGKSTLAASFATGGFRFLADDGLVLEPRDAGYAAQPCHPSIRLWEDSQRELIAPDAVQTPPVQCTEKARFLADDGIAHCDRSLPLKQAYFLGDGRARSVTFEPMLAPAAMLEWVRNSYLLDPKERPMLAAHFEAVATLAGRLRCYRLDYPRRFAALPSLRQAIVQHVEREGATA
jgi:hypothetical protein